MSDLTAISAASAAATSGMNAASQAAGYLAPATPLPDLAAPNAVTAAARASIAGAAPADFGALVSQGLDGVQADWTQAQGAMRALAEGQPVNLHQVMMRMEESRISFQLFLQVRNRLLESYQDVMRMQV